VHKHPYPSSLALTGFFAQSQTHLIAPAASAAIIFAVPLHPTNALALSMLANAVGSDLTAAEARQKHAVAPFKNSHAGDGRYPASLVANLRTIDVAELLKVTEGMP
jgi:hypothetical protein